jgi:hypothetical protein
MQSTADKTVCVSEILLTDSLPPEKLIKNISLQLLKSQSFCQSSDTRTQKIQEKLFIQFLAITTFFEISPKGYL